MKISLSRHAIAKNKETRREGLIRMSWYLTSITSPSPSIGTYAIIYERLSDRRECRNKVGLIRIRMRFIGLTRMRFVGLIRMSSGSSDEVVSIAIVWIHMYNMQIDMRAIIWWKPAQALVVVKNGTDDTHIHATVIAICLLPPLFSESVAGKYLSMDHHEIRHVISNRFIRKREGMQLMFNILCPMQSVLNLHRLMHR